MFSSFFTSTKQPPVIEFSGSINHLVQTIDAHPECTTLIIREGGLGSLRKTTDGGYTSDDIIDDEKVRKLSNTLSKRAFKRLVIASGEFSPSAFILFCNMLTLHTPEELYLQDIKLIKGKIPDLLSAVALSKLTTLKLEAYVNPVNEMNMYYVSAHELAALKKLIVGHHEYLKSISIADISFLEPDSSDEDSCDEYNTDTDEFASRDALDALEELYAEETTHFRPTLHIKTLGASTVTTFSQAASAIPQQPTESEETHSQRCSMM